MRFAITIIFLVLASSVFALIEYDKDVTPHVIF